MEAIQTGTVSELAEALLSGWQELATAIDVSATGWEDRTLEPEDDSDAWSPRLAAWHAITGERLRVAYLEHIVSDAAGDDPPDMMAFMAAGGPGFDPEATRAQFSVTKTPDEMRVVLAAARDDTTALVSRLQDEQLGQAAKLTGFMHEYLTSHGQSPGDDVRGVLLHGAVHLRDHARQITDA